MYIKWLESEKKQKYFWKIFQFLFFKKRVECGGSFVNIEFSFMEIMFLEDFKLISYLFSDKLINIQLMKIMFDFSDVKINFFNELCLFKNIVFVSNLKIEDFGNLKVLKDEVYYF